MKYPDPPAHKAGEEAWLKWVNDVCPLNCCDYSGPPELFMLTRTDNRELAAYSARGYFAIQAKKRQPRPQQRAHVQCGFGFDGDGGEK